MDLRLADAPVAALVDVRSGGELCAAWLRSVLFTPFGSYIDGVYWTLGVEIAFYGIVLALIGLGKLRLLDHLSLLIAVVSTAFCCFVYIVEPGSSWRAGERLYELALIVHGAQFAAGVFLWGLLFRRVTTLRTAGLVIAIGGGALQVWHKADVDQVRLLAVGLWLASIGSIALSVKGNAWFDDRLSASALGAIRILGIATYPFYLVHNIVGAAMMGALANIGLSDLMCLAAALAASFALSLLIAIKLEPMVAKHLRERLGGQSRPAIA